MSPKSLLTDYLKCFRAVALTFHSVIMEGFEELTLKLSRVKLSDIFDLCPFAWKANRSIEEAFTHRFLHIADPSKQTSIFYTPWEYTRKNKVTEKLLIT